MARLYHSRAGEASPQIRGQTQSHAPR